MPQLKQTSWDPIWDQIYAQQAWGKYPPEELIRFVARNYYKVESRDKVRFLEVGCGGGACIWFAAREGFNASGIDGSQKALDQANELLKRDKLSATLICGDVSDLATLVSENSYDSIFDIACLQHNKFSQIEDMIKQIFNCLRQGGRFFSMMVSLDTLDGISATQVEPGTYVDIKSGPLKNRGLVHLSSLEEVKLLFRDFAELEIDYSRKSFQNGEFKYNQIICSGMKPL